MVVGIAPTRGFELLDGQYVNGIANGNNSTFQTMTAKSGGAAQATATQIGANARLVNVGTVAGANDSIMLNFAVAGREILVYNGGAQIMNVYASPVPNKANGNVLDTINGGTNPTPVTVAAKASAIYFCPANGIWAAK